LSRATSKGARAQPPPHTITVIHPFRGGGLWRSGIAHRAPRGTLCLITALARHGLTDIIPPSIDIALPRGSRIPTLRKTIDVHVFARETFDLGQEELAVGDKLSVGIYSPERTLIDIIRLRHREGPDVAWEGLRRWLARKGSKPAALLVMAKHFPGRPMSSYSFTHWSAFSSV
jgi:hypothetical protein